MDATEHPAVNGHAADTQASALPVAPLHLPNAREVQTRPSPVPAQPFTGLTAGDEIDPVDEGPVERHLIAVRPEPRERLARLRTDDPIIPVWVTDGSVRKEKIALGRRMAWRAFLLGLVNSHFVFRVFVWILRGLKRWIQTILRWVLDMDSHPLSGAIQAKTQTEYDKAMVLRSRRVSARSRVLGIAALAVTVTGVTVWITHPWIAWIIATVTMAFAAHTGAPETVKILSPGVRRHVVPRVTCTLVARALAEVVDDKTARAIRADSDQLWRSGFVEVPHGVRIQIVLPGAAVSRGLIPHEQRIASALGRPEDCAVVEPLPRITTGHFDLYIFDKPVLGGAPIPGPLTRAKRTSFFKPVELGRTRTGKPHTECLYGGAWFIGAKPNFGKSSLAMVALAHAILDPYTIPITVNLKMSADYAWAKAVCHTYLNGAPEIDRTILDRFYALVEWLMAEAGRRGEFLTRLAEKGEVTENHVTEEIARKYKELRPIIAIFDEIHRAFDENINPKAKEFARLLADLIKACRFVGITIICVTQLAGRDSIDPALTRGARVRACLRVSESTSFRQIMGDSGAGAFERLGIGRLPAGTAIINSDEGDCVKIGVHYPKDHLWEIGKRALALRQAMHTLAGEAAGEAPPVEATDPAELLRHILDVIAATAPAGGPADREVAWVSELETVLTARHETYTGRANGWLTGELRARRIPTAGLNRKVPATIRASGQRNEAGIRAGDVRAVLETMLTVEPPTPDPHGK
jgi:hypothetical protein